MILIEQLLRKPDINKIKQQWTDMRRPIPISYIHKNDLCEVPRYFRMPPLLAGSFNHWQYSQMYKIEDFVAMMDQDYEDVIQKMINEGKISE